MILMRRKVTESVNESFSSSDESEAGKDTETVKSPEGDRELVCSDVSFKKKSEEEFDSSNCSSDFSETVTNSKKDPFGSYIIE